VRESARERENMGVCLRVYALLCSSICLGIPFLARALSVCIYITCAYIHTDAWHSSAASRLVDIFLTGVFSACISMHIHIHSYTYIALFSSSVDEVATISTNMS